MELKGKNILVTGGASFIGSHLVEKLLARSPKNILVVDDLSSGKKENIAKYVSSGVEFAEADLREPGVARNAMKGMDVVFHLAAAHGGRGYVDLHQADPALNNYLSGCVVYEAVRQGTKVVFASSGCAYPNYMQQDTGRTLFLREEDVRGNLSHNAFDPDNEYGWEKLTTERVIKAQCDEGRIAGVSTRFFTVYGPRGKEDHAIMAMIARAFVKQNPFELWGSGKQIRNWTYVGDIVRGMVRSAEKIDDGSAVNLGTMEAIKVADAPGMIVDYMRQVLPSSHKDYEPEIKLRQDMPEGPPNRVADKNLADKLLGGDWQRVSFEDGLRQTIDWYVANKNPEEVLKIVKEKLTER